MLATIRSQRLCFVAICLAVTTACAQDETQTPRVTSSIPSEGNSDNTPKPEGDAAKTEIATFGGGCFWCVEAVFENVKGVTNVVSGYEGGRTRNPNYKQICTGRTGHAEVCQIHFDPSVVSFDELLEIFWKTHDPTTLNQQGPDIGTQYRSVIFYHNEKQKELAEKYKKKLDESGAFDNKIVTEIKKTQVFYEAEDYHQDYFRLNPGQSYCAFVVQPKVDKFKKAFADKLAEPKK